MFTVAYSQLSYTHSFNSNGLIENSNCFGIHASCMIILLFIIHWLYRATTSITAPFCQFYAYLSVFFVRLCFQFLDRCEKLIMDPDMPQKHKIIFPCTFSNRKTCFKALLCVLHFRLFLCMVKPSSTFPTTLQFSSPNAHFEYHVVQDPMSQFKATQWIH